MKLFALKTLLPVATFSLATIGAVGSVTSESKSSVADVQGWRRVSPFNCVQAKLCNNIGDVICKDGIYDMYGKATSTSDCTQLLTHKP